MKTRDYLHSINNLPGDYFQSRIDFEEYRSKRKRLLIMLDEEINGVKYFEPESEAVNESVLSKALSLLKFDNA